jgi:general secretion pathway protein L
MPRHVLGIEIGPEHLTAVQLTGTSKAPGLSAAVRQPLPPTTDAAEQAEVQCQALRELLQTQPLRADTVVTVLPAHRAVLRTLSVPFKDPRRIRQVLNGALEDHIPFEPEDIVADFLTLPSQPAGEIRLLTAALPRQIIAEHLSIMQAASLEPTVIDLDVFALANAARFGTGPQGDTAVLIDLSPSRTLMTMLYKQTAVFARSMAHVMPPDDTSVEAMTSRLGKQLQHTLYACEHALQQPYEPEMLVLSGPWGSQLEPLAAALQDATGLHTRVWRCGDGASRANGARLSRTEQASYAVAFGAACRGLHRQSIGVNFRRDSFALHRDLQEMRGRLIGLGVMLVLVACLGLGGLYLDIRVKSQRYEQLQQNIAQVFRDTLPTTRAVQPLFQMRSNIGELEKRLQAFGGATGAQLSGLQILREISARAPQAITLEVDALTITTATTDLSGTTSSYDHVVKLKEALEASPFFPTVKITNTRTKDDKVAFKLTIITATPQDNVT